MKPIGFKECNTVFAKNQDQYLNLPAHISEDGEVTTCWKLSPREREEFLKTGILYLQVLTFDRPLLPVKISIEKPI